MTKEQYAAQLAREMKVAGHKMNCDQAEKFIAALFKSIGEGLAKSREVTISNFGTFFVAKYSSKIIKSPRGDKREFFMPPTDVIKWKPSLKIRSRAGSRPVEKEEYDLLLSHKLPEEEPPLLELEINPIKRVDPYAVQINFLAKSRGFMNDDRSPISRLVKKIINEMIEIGAEVAEIRPLKEKSQLLYLAQHQTLESHLIPKISHQIIVEKIRTLAKPEINLPSDEKVILTGDEQRIKVYSTLTPFGELIVLERL